MGKFTNSLLCKIYGKEWTTLQICNFLLLFQFIYCRWKIVSLWKIYAHTILLWNAQKTIAYCCRYRKQKKVSFKKHKRRAIQRKWTRSRRRMTLWCQRGQEEIMIVFGWRRMEEIILFVCFTNSYEKSRIKNKLNRTSNLLALWPQKLDWRKKKMQECVWLGSHD